MVAWALIPADSKLDCRCGQGDGRVLAEGMQGSRSGSRDLSTFDNRTDFSGKSQHLRIGKRCSSIKSLRSSPGIAAALASCLKKPAAPAMMRWPGNDCS